MIALRAGGKHTRVNHGRLGGISLAELGRVGDNRALGNAGSWSHAIVAHDTEVLISTGWGAGLLE